MLILHLRVEVNRYNLAERSFGGQQADRSWDDFDVGTDGYCKILYDCEDFGFSALCRQS